MLNQKFYPYLDTTLQRQSIIGLCNVYHDSIETFERYYERHFPQFEQTQQNLIFVRPPMSYQPSWSDILSNLNKTTSTAVQKRTVMLRPSQMTQLGKTRAYQTKSLMPGYCNQEKTCAQTYKKQVPSTPSSIYSRPDINRHDRQFKHNMQIISVYQLTAAEWIKYAQECLRQWLTSPKMFTIAKKFEPLQTYVTYLRGKTTITTTKKGGVSGVGTTERDTPPRILAAKLTDAQKTELLDAYYWCIVQKKEEYKSVLFFYKMYGYYVRPKDGYRMTKLHDARQLTLKRQRLIDTGQIVLKAVKVKPADHVKSRRGRKRKVNHVYN